VFFQVVLAPQENSGQKKGGGRIDASIKGNKQTNDASRSFGKT